VYDDEAALKAVERAGAGAAAPGAVPGGGGGDGGGKGKETEKSEKGEKAREQCIFAAFPHGVISFHHGIMMSDKAGFLSKFPSFVHMRRDLVASITLAVPPFQLNCQPSRLWELWLQGLTRRPLSSSTASCHSCGLDFEPAHVIPTQYLEIA